ncbi:peptidyl-prolyl cis-trans isomerase [Fusobacterium animalis ATCC 51191]|uniref:Peptidyl-prolyl cis-trans isomerase n=1 Tax=Fusobacterium animalis ATCC 51191 TaxID=997347 RepID=F9ERM6_9FUSO|nr:peptidyl-prolyl cis-trans isomerase [Fusobacterium animalis ATCC 51191]
MKNIKKCGSIIKELKFNKNFWRGSMEEDKVLHGILLKKAKEAQYTNYEIEQLNLQSESLFIRYYLEREAAKIVENTNIEEDVLKKYMKKIKNYISLLKK